MPRLRADGAAPAATLRRPSLTMAWARTVAVVVPSPATSLVLVATSLASWAPRFSYESSSSISRAMVTPSFVIVGAPHFLSMTTLRPLGPSVTFTASASALTPRSRARRASSSNCRSLAAMRPSFHTRVKKSVRTDCGDRARMRSVAAGEAEALLLDDREHVAGGEDEVLLVVVLDLGAAVLAVDHDVTDLDVERHALGAVLVEAAGAHREDGALLRLLLGGVGDDEAGGRRLLRLERLDEDAVLER